MIITIFYVLLLIVQIILLVKSTKENNKKRWSMLFSTIVLSILLVLLFFIYSWINIDYLGWASIYYLFLCVCSGAAYILMLIISIIIKVIKYKKSDDIDFKFFNKPLIITLSTIFIIFLLSLFVQDLPYKIEEKNDKIFFEKAREEIIVLLEKRYGDGNFKILEMAEKDICYSCSWMGPGIDGYEFLIDTDYFDKDFTITLTKEDFKIYEDEFLDNYYEENLGITDLENYVMHYKTNKLNEIIGQKFNVKIGFNNIFFEDTIEKDYGYVPTIDELSTLVELHDPKIEINENITSKEDLLDYLVKFTKFFIKELEPSMFHYSQTDKYFRYKYDYTKLGVYNYTDQFNGYGGYVLAGDYKYSEEKGHYVLINEDKIIRINIMGKVTTFNVEDILKD